MENEIDLFLSNLAVERGLSTNTISAYSVDLAHVRQIVDESNRSTWREVAQHSIRGYSQSMGPSFSPRSRARRLAALRTFFGFLLKEGLIESNPSSLVHFPKLGPQLPRTLTAAQIDCLLAQPQVSRPLGSRDKAMFELLYACGLLVSEVA
jgi:integrase/recombinase XerD